MKLEAIAEADVAVQMGRTAEQSFLSSISKQLEGHADQVLLGVSLVALPTVFHDSHLILVQGANPSC